MSSEAAFLVPWGLSLALLVHLGRRLLPQPWAFLPALTLLVAPATEPLYLLGGVTLGWLGLRSLERPGLRRRLELAAVGALVVGLQLDCFALPAWLRAEAGTPASAVVLEPWLLWLPVVVYGVLFVRLLLYLPVNLLPGGPGNPWARKSRWLLGLFGALQCIELVVRPEFASFLAVGPLLYLSWTIVLADWSVARPSNSPGLPPRVVTARRRWAAIVFLVALALPALLLLCRLGLLAT